MSGLHGGDHSELGEARNVLRRYHLGMFNAEPSIAGGWRLMQGAPVGIKCHSVGGITNGVRANLKAALERPPRQVVDRGFWCCRLAFALPRVVLGLQEDLCGRS